MGLSYPVDRAWSGHYAEAERGVEDLGETALITAASSLQHLWQATCHAGIFWSRRLLQHTDGVRARPCRQERRGSAWI